MLNSSELVFPQNVVVFTAAAMEGIDDDITVLKRPLRKTDPDLSIGLFATLWEPDEESREIGKRYPGETTLNRYIVAIQCLIKDGDEERGLATHSVLSKRVRTVLVRNEALRVGLTSLHVSDGSSEERTMRWAIRSQRFMNNDIDGQFVFISTLEFWLETETS